MVILTLTLPQKTLNQSPYQLNSEEFQFKTDQGILVQFVSNLIASQVCSCCENLMHLN